MFKEDKGRFGKSRDHSYLISLKIVALGQLCCSGCVHTTFKTFQRQKYFIVLKKHKAIFETTPRLILPLSQLVDAYI